MTMPRRQSGKVQGYVQNPGSTWLDQHWSTLPIDEWVAADPQGLVAHDSSIDALMAKLKDQNISATEVAIAFVSKDHL